ncbi:MAG: flagellar hook capping protein [Candidatus Hydrogenedentes bacterium]|nr:flagellar hook capping protein [Candidatus Hydrogenedentota bacterium]
MNALVAVRSNATGLQNLPRQQRVEAARQVSSNVIAKARAVAKANANAVAQKDGATVSENAYGERVVNNELGRDAFLQLLVLQMQNQDPLEPVDNTEMIAQLAQFSALEQMTELNDGFGQMSADFGQLSFITAGNLVGHTVSGLDANGILREGAVERAIYERGVVYLEVAGELVPLANLTKVE